MTDTSGPELFASWRHHAFITNRTGDAVELDADHRAHAVVELAIRDLKHGAGLNHCPWGCSTSTPPGWSPPPGPQPVRWTQLLATTTSQLQVAKTIRRRLLSIPGRITRTGRRSTLHCPPAGPGPTRSSTRSNDYVTLPAAA